MSTFNIDEDEEIELDPELLQGESEEIFFLDASIDAEAESAGFSDWQDVEPQVYYQLRFPFLRITIL